MEILGKLFLLIIIGSVINVGFGLYHTSESWADGWRWFGFILGPVSLGILIAFTIKL